MPPSPSCSSTPSVLPMDTERTPLRSDGWTVHTQHEALYQRFSPTQKRVLVALVSIAKDLNSTGSSFCKPVHSGYVHGFSNDVDRSILSACLFLWADRLVLQGILLGLALAPLAGGTAAHYASWRTMQYSIGLSV
ncbi:hypothetical protein BDQ17DRAFT_1376425 [Cyathus striatus]|nr:hypothetical protein BDQ17DRAFT_1376425 [Cyathus striatus]